MPDLQKSKLKLRLLNVEMLEPQPEPGAKPLSRKRALLAILKLSRAEGHHIGLRFMPTHDSVVSEWRCIRCKSYGVLTGDVDFNTVGERNWSFEGSLLRPCPLPKPKPRPKPAGRLRAIMGIK